MIGNKEDKSLSNKQNIDNDASPIFYGILIGIVWCIILCLLGLAGYSVWIRYGFLVVLLFLVVSSLFPLRKLPIKQYVRKMFIICLLSLLGIVLGDWGRKVLIFDICRLLKPVLKEIQDYHLKNGHYPKTLNKIKSISSIQKKLGLRIDQRKISNEGYDIDGIDSSDVVIYFDNNQIEVLVPVTKKFPFSFSRFYVYIWSTDDPNWEYDYLIWRYFKSS